MTQAERALSARRRARDKKLSLEEERELIDEMFRGISRRASLALLEEFDDDPQARQSALELLKDQGEWWK